MSASISASSPVEASAGVLINVLKASQEAQVASIEKLISVSAQTTVQSQKMETIGQIIDCYA